MLFSRVLLGNLTHFAFFNHLFFSQSELWEWLHVQLLFIVFSLQHTRELANYDYSYCTDGGA